jgi:arylsulfatase A-like enzyme
VRNGTKPILGDDGTKPIRGGGDGTKPILAGILVLLNLASTALAELPKRPNILLIMTDDQGYGDLGFHGNPQIKTPRLDALARESAQFRSFYVSPVCSPTRSSLMTGRYAYRTGVVDTFRGRSMMHPDEVTIAEILSANGYRTGIFGKWHLGDNAPLRPIDQGFQEALVHRGGGIGQVSDPPGNTYFDPTLMHNGKETPTKGYCSDVYTDAAQRFIEADRDRPFFAYVAFNAPHEPLQVPDRDLKAFEGLDPYRGEPGEGHPLPASIPAEVTAKVYAMVANIDANVGRLLDKLDSLGLARDTIVVFLTDNGPQQPRYNAGMLDRKGSVHEGGIRVPCFVRWPGTIEAGRVVDKIAGSIDLTPTLLEACGVAKPESVHFDGRSLLPLLKGDSAGWPDRTLYFQWHRGDVPQLHRAFAVRSDRYKLVQPRGVEPLPLPALLPYQLFDMVTDAREEHDIAADHPDIVEGMLQGYEEWFRDVQSSRNFAPPRIHLGSTVEDPVTLTRQDFRGEATAWEPGEMGGWEVEVVGPGLYDLDIIFVQGRAGAVHVELGGITRSVEITEGSRTCRIEGFELKPGPGRLRAWVDRPENAVAIYQLIVHRRVNSR